MYNVIPFIKALGITSSLYAITYEEDFGIGDMKGAYRFIDFLERSNCTVWKLPSMHEMSPKGDALISAFAFDMLVIDIKDIPDFDNDRYAAFLSGKRRSLHEKNVVDFDAVRAFKSEVLPIAFESFYISEYEKDTARAKEFKAFIAANEYWITDYALFKSLIEVYKEDITEWPDPILMRDQKALDSFTSEHEKNILMYTYIQWIAYTQWTKLRSYAAEHAVYLLGEMPFFVSTNSSEVWAHREIFDVSKRLAVNSIVGTPPNTTYPSGQLWEFPAYDWKNNAKEKYIWWMHRFTMMSLNYDGFNIDHFRGFIKFWKVKDGKGAWEKGPGREFLNTIAKEFIDTKLKFIYAEVFSDEPNEVETSRIELGFEGTKTFVLDFKSLVSYILDNADDVNVGSTSNGCTKSLAEWWEGLGQPDREFLIEKIKSDGDVHAEQIPDVVRWKIIEHLLCEEFPLKLFPLYDILPPVPGGTDKNTFRMGMNIEDLLQDKMLIDKLYTYTDVYSLNSHFRGYKIRSVPEIHDEVHRSYLTNENITVWAFIEGDTGATITTNLPIEGNMSHDIKEIKLQKIIDTSSGVLYSFCQKALEPGDYVLSIKDSEDKVRSFENKFEIKVESPKKGLWK